MALLTLAIVPGCSIVGTWDAPQDCPWGASDELESVPARITLRDDGTYAARVTYGGKETTNQGKYEWTGRRLIITPRGHRSRTYTGWHWDKYLRLSAKYKGQTVHCTLTRVSE